MLFVRLLAKGGSGYYGVFHISWSVSLEVRRSDNQLLTFFATRPVTPFDTVQHAFLLSHRCQRSGSYVRFR